MRARSRHGNARRSRGRAVRVVGALLAGIAGILYAPGVGPTRLLAAPDAPASVLQPDVCSPAWLEDRAPWATFPTSTAGAYAVQAAVPAQLGPATSRLDGTVGPDSASEPLEPTSRYPNDTYFRLYQRSSLMQMGALDAWETSHGGADVVVAVISTGVHYTHPDLADKMWRNPGEVEGNGVDDDHNGYVDDIVGWSFPDDSNAPEDIPRGRGTMMAGAAAAATNNEEGIAGVSWGARIMALKTLVLQRDEDGEKFVGTVNDLVRAVCYAANNSAQVIVFGGYLQNPGQVADDLERLRQAVDYAHTQGAIVVAPAGDCKLPQDFCPPEEYYPDPEIFPAAFRHVIGVQAFTAGLTARDEASSGSWVDISAPGEEFMTTSSDPPYSYVRHQRATSDFAAAHVAGVAAVMRSVNPNITPYQVEQALCETATRPRDVPFDYPPSGPPRNDTWGCGMVNFERAVESVPPLVRAVVVSPIRLGVEAAPAELRQITDGQRSWPEVRFHNPYLSASAWEIVADVAWVAPAAAWDLADGTSGGSVGADLDLLREASGPLQSGSVYTSELKACARGWDPDRAPCQAFSYRLGFLERLKRIFVPYGASRAVVLDQG